MKTHVFVSLGKEIDQETRDVILNEFKKHNLRVNSGSKPSGVESIGFKIHLKVANREAFEENIKQLVQQLSYLYLIAPSNCLENLKHHPRIKCYDTSFIKDPAKAASVLIKYAYHGFPL